SDKKQVALTFDDGPDPKYTREILDILKKYNVKAATTIIISTNGERT
ncbi:MAG: polysaccharide deacetylase family protein, partial [Firmicutes bacterium]|nr:polysaccharide deacetylase family protein [Bacillota bacterium]